MAVARDLCSGKGTKLHESPELGSGHTAAGLSTSRLSAGFDLNLRAVEARSGLPCLLGKGCLSRHGRCWYSKEA